MSGIPIKPPHTDETAAALTAIYNWNYDSEIDQLRSLYANALDRQWISVRDLDWDRGIDRGAFAKTFSLGGFPVQKTEFWQNLDSNLKWEVSRKSTAFMLSNFLHGEQGALMVASQMVSAVPHMDAKFYAATQTVDEARHVEVFAAYIQLLGEVSPIMPSLKKVLDATIGTGSWLEKAVGMQMVVEGLALHVFRDMRDATQEPLLKQLLTYVSRDEARHCSYGVRYLSAVVGSLSEAERHQLEDFAFEAARLLVDSRSGGSMRTSMLEIWKQAGLDPQAVFAELAKEREKIDPEMQRTNVAGPVRGFIIPSLKTVGLFSERLEKHFRGMFEANFGERAKTMAFADRLPDDLEAWLEGAA
jgi:rubrerythrin